MEKYKQEVLEGLQVEEEGLSDFMRKKLKQESLQTDNDPFHNVYTPKGAKHRQVLKPQGRRKRRHNRRKRRKTVSHGVHQVLESPVHDFEPHFDLKRKRVTRAATARKERVWDYGVIPYEIGKSYSDYDIYQ